MDKRNDKVKLIWIKIIHTIIWIICVAAISYIIVAAILDAINVWVWICIGLIILEGVVLLIYRWRCPLTILAEKYTDDRNIGFDIFLPAWLAKHNKTIFSILFLIGLTLVFWRSFFQ